MKSKLVIGLILVLATIIRIIPITRFGYVLDEYDPYFNYKVTRYMVKEGFMKFFKWHDDTVWYPKGRDIFITTYPGMMFYTYLLHKIITMFYVEDVYNTCVVFPILGGLFTLMSVYKLTSYLSNKRCAIIALFLASFVPGLSQRTMAGFYDYECISVGLINFCLLYYLKYTKSKRLRDLAMFIFVYLNLGLCWGGYVFVINLIALHSIVNLITNRYQKKISDKLPRLVCKSFDIHVFPVLYLVGNSLLYAIPVIGKRCFLSQEQIIPLFALLLHMLSVKKLRIPALVLVPIVLSVSNSAFKTGKLLNLLVKQKGSAIVESISEHQPRGYVKFFLDCNIIMFIMPMSFDALYNLENNENTFMLIYATISVFISGKMARCILVTAPCFCICSSLYIGKLYNKVKDNIFKKRMFMGLSSILSLYYMLHSFNITYHFYSLPQLLLYTSEGKVINDFHETYQFLSRFDGVILNWWDFGYQINAYSRMKTLNDNNTNDWDRIKEVAQIFMSSEKDAYDLCIKNKIGCVFIVSGVDTGYKQDMIGKLSWIDKIASENCNFKNAGIQSLIYKLVYYGNQSNYDHARKFNYRPVELKHFALAYRSNANIVKIYQVLK